MKNKIYLFLITTLLLGACSKDFLELKPNASATDESFYTTEKAADEAVIAVYDVLQWAVEPKDLFNYDTEFSTLALNDFASDDAITGGDNLSNDVPSAQDIGSWTFRTDNTILSGYYKAMYIGIFRANIAIEKIPKIDMDTVKRNRLVGEAKFLRAFYYFRLINTFGGVPLVDHIITNPKDYVTPKSDTSVIWRFIENDLQYGVKVLPIKNLLSPTDLGRVTKEAALTLLAKSYLFREKWAQAKEACLQVINTPGVALWEDYYTLFQTVNKNNKESIFEIQHMAPVGNWVWNEKDANGNQGTYVFSYINWRGGSFKDKAGTLPYSTTGWYPYWGFSLPTQSLYNAFEAGDPRIKRTLIQDGDSVMNPNSDNNTYPYLYMFPGRDKVQGSRTGYFARKYEILPSNYGGSANFYASDLNLIVFRLADVFLMCAEASCHTQDYTTAQFYLEKVRERARRGALPGVLPEIKATGDELLEAVKKERRVELALEQHRMYDLKRWKTAKAALAVEGKIFDESKNYVYPLPLDEIQLSEGVLKQNPNY